MTNTKSATVAFSHSASFLTETQEHLKQHCEPASKSLNHFVHQTLFLLATPAGWIADHSKKPVSSCSHYTDRYEQALSYISFEAATKRAKAIIDIEPEIKVLPIEVICPADTYPLGWRGANE